MAYATYADMVAEGFDDPAERSRIEYLLNVASEYIDHFTGLFFEERALTLLVDGSGLEVLFVPIPIIDVNQIKIDDEVQDLNSFVVYNRMFPDDRTNPKIKIKKVAGTIFTGKISRFTKGQQNIELSGKFGYLERDNVAAAGLTVGTEIGPFDIDVTNNILKIKVDGGVSETVNLTFDPLKTAQDVIDEINAGTTGLTVYITVGKVAIKSNTTGASSSIEFETIADSAYAALGFTVGIYSGIDAPLFSIPKPIKRVCILLVRRELPLIADVGERSATITATSTGGIVSETTDRHSYKLGEPDSVPAFTWDSTGLSGDPEIDTVLLTYRAKRPKRVDLV